MGQIIEITGNGQSLHKDRGFLAVRQDGKTLGRVPLDDIDAVISAAHGLYWSANALSALAERSVPIVLIGSNFVPTAHILPISAHHIQGHIMQAQAEASLPLRKRLWAQIVRAKITAQAEALTLLERPNERLLRLAKNVKSGDPDNREAQAAQYYWPLLLGPKFHRDRSANDANALLNYGYTILRSCTARAIVAAGLNPALSLHHASDGQALRLADDLMEPFRPAIDIAVYDLITAGTDTVDKTAKTALAAIMQWDYKTDNGHSPLSQVLVRLSQSLAKVYQKEIKQLDLPSPLLPLKQQELELDMI